MGLNKYKFISEENFLYNTYNGSIVKLESNYEHHI